jgi:hypothetical protein
MKWERFLIAVAVILVLGTAAMYVAELRMVKTNWHIQTGAGFSTSDFRSVNEPTCDLVTRTCVITGPVRIRNNRTSWSAGPVTVLDVSLVEPDEHTFFLR